ncbi:Protein YIPF5 [Morella rubra]|uniref:Protein YIP n=1 Tax=Morella rubra TaxID=262757 RepID=A0A6A1WLH3_9ROSI|nr:Protein YIPF5 [Morella rubra]
MSKQFNVPPVIFPSGPGGDSGGPSSAAQRHPMPPFQPRPAATNPIPFMSFDVGSVAQSASFSAPQLGPTITSANPNFDDEPPLLEELGINTKHIWSKTISILNPLRPNPNLQSDADLSGPFLFFLAFGLFQLLAGKFHFGILLGWATISAVFLYIVFNMLAGRNGGLDLYRCLSLIGYSMLPMVILSALSLFVPQGGPVILVIAAAFVVWSTRVCARLLVEAASWNEHPGLVAYACFLIYTLFSLLVIF